MAPRMRMLQQIALLIMIDAVYVRGIRNAGSGGGSSSMPEISSSSSSSSSTDSFRPSQLIEFTPSDASGPASFIYSGAGGNENVYNNNYNNVDAQYATEAALLPKTPILSYRDPLTNENHRYTPTTPRPSSSSSSSSFSSPSAPSAHSIPATRGRQEFTVHSSMLVQNHRYGGGSPSSPFEPNYSSHPSPTFDLSPPTSSPYALSPKFDPHPPPHESPNAIRGFDRESTPPPRLSYASKDYPPPSYLQKPQPTSSNYRDDDESWRPQSPGTSSPTPASSPSSSLSFPSSASATSATSSSPPSWPSSSRPSFATSSPNYANSNIGHGNDLGNYLPMPDEPYPLQPQQQYQREQQQYSQPQYQPQYPQQNPYQYQQEQKPYQYQQQETYQQQSQYQKQDPHQQQGQYPYQHRYQQQQQPHQPQGPTSNYYSWPSPSPSPSSSYTGSQGVPFPPTLGHPPYQPSRGGPPPPRPSYTNYYGDYQLGEIPPATRPVLPPQPPHNNNYYNQRPPAPSSYRPGPPPSSAGSLASLASLFSTTQQYAPQFTNLLLGGLGGGGGGAGAGAGSNGGGSSNALGSLLGAFTGGGGGGSGSIVGAGGGPLGGAGVRPINAQLIRALENIARNDDLECVPKVLCQMIASQTQRGQLPTFVTSPAITNFLAAFPASSPALIYGRAALLGISGGVRSCVQTYAKCPKNEDEILYYLNNHRGGFFKFFSEPEPEAQRPQHSSSSPSASSSAGSSSSLFSILSALTGNPLPTPPPTTTTPRPRPTARPTAASTDITSTIGNFFTNLLSDYVGGIEYQRRRRRRRRSVSGDGSERAEIEAAIETEAVPEDFHDEEDDEDTQGSDDETQENENQGSTNQETEDGWRGIDESADSDYQDSDNEDSSIEDSNTEDSDNDDSGIEDASDSVQYPGVEGRILNREIKAHRGPRFFPGNEKGAEQTPQESRILASVEAFNRESARRKLKFPSATAVRQYEEVRAGQADGGERVHFRDEEGPTDDGSSSSSLAPSHVNFVDGDGNDDDHHGLPSRRGKRVRFQDDDQVAAATAHVDGTIVFPKDPVRQGRILNRRPAYGAAPFYRSEDEQDRLVVSDSKRPSSTAYYDESTTRAPNHNYDKGFHSQSSTQSNQFYNSDHYSSTYHSSNYINHSNQQSNRYAGNNYNNYHSRYETSRTTRRPHEDDKNIYVTNAQGLTEYYITPDGRKIYL